MRAACDTTIKVECNMKSKQRTKSGKRRFLNSLVCGVETLESRAVLSAFTGPPAVDFHSEPFHGRQSGLPREQLEVWSANHVSLGARPMVLESYDRPFGLDPYSAPRQFDTWVIFVLAPPRAPHGGLPLRPPPPLPEGEAAPPRPQSAPPNASPPVPILKAQIPAHNDVRTAPSVVIEDVFSAPSRQLTTNSSDVVSRPALPTSERASVATIAKLDSTGQLVLPTKSNTTFSLPIFERSDGSERVAYEIVMDRSGRDSRDQVDPQVMVDTTIESTTERSDSARLVTRRIEVDHNFPDRMPEGDGLVELNTMLIGRIATENRRLRLGSDLGNDIEVIARRIAKSGDAVDHWSRNVDAAMDYAVPRPMLDESGSSAPPEAPYEDGGLVEVLATEHASSKNVQAFTDPVVENGASGAEVGMYRDIEVVGREEGNGDEVETPTPVPSASSGDDSNDAESPSSADQFLVPLLLVGGVCISSRRRRRTGG